MQIPFGKPHFGDDEIAAVSDILRKGWIGMGPETLAFETELAQALGAPRVVTVSSCTGALFLSLLAAGTGPGDEVICPSLTWCSSANAALYLGARAVFCDIDPHTMCLDAASVAARLTPATRAVVVVHYGGLAVDVRALRAALPDHVAIVEDCAHALGARYPDGTPVGSSGNLCCFSFYANKNLSTGEGGAIALADDAVAGRLASLRQHGLNNDAWSRYSRPAANVAIADLTELGYKLNYTDLQACIGRVQLRRQPEFAAHRRAVAALYMDELRRHAPDVRWQSGLDDDRHARHLFVVELPLERMRRDRDGVVNELRGRGLGLSIHYPPLHRMPLYAPAAALPVTEALAPRIVTLPIGNAITLDEARVCVRALIEALA